MREQGREPGRLVRPRWRKKGWREPPSLPCSPRKFSKTEGRRQTHAAIGRVLCFPGLASLHVLPSSAVGWDLGEAWPAQDGVSSSGRDSQSVTVLQLEAREWVLTASTQTIKTSFSCAN